MSERAFEPEPQQNSELAGTANDNTKHETHESAFSLSQHEIFEQIAKDYGNNLTVNDLKNSLTKAIKYYFPNRRPPIELTCTPFEKINKGYIFKIDARFEKMNPILSCTITFEDLTLIKNGIRTIVKSPTCFIISVKK